MGWGVFLGFISIWHCSVNDPLLTSGGEGGGGGSIVLFFSALPYKVGEVVEEGEGVGLALGLFSGLRSGEMYFARCSFVRRG